MARIVLTTWGSYGDINPYLGLALALKARGHEPILATAAYYRPVAEREGVVFRAVRPDIDPGDSEIVARAMHPRRGPEVILREVMLPTVEDAYEDLQEAVRGTDVDEFRETVQSGIDELHAAGIEVVLMNAQFSRDADAIIRFEPYLDVLREVADANQVPVFDRHGLMCVERLNAALAENVAKPVVDAGDVSTELGLSSGKTPNRGDPGVR